MTSSSPVTLNGQVDAYRAVLSLDKDIFTAAMRLELLDVADAAANGQPGRDGVFDEHDIQLLLDRFAFFENERLSNGGAKDLSRYDLNGDGFTGGTTFATKFDLDINTPPLYSVFSQQVGSQTTQFDENFLNDLDILCYYAHTSSLFTGSETLRDELLVDCPSCSSNKSPNELHKSMVPPIPITGLCSRGWHCHFPGTLVEHHQRHMDFW